MDNRYRSQSYDQDNRRKRSRQEDQFNTGSDDQYADAGWRTQENERWQSGPDYDRGYGRNDPFGGSWTSAGEQRRDSRSFEDYDRSYGSARGGSWDRGQGSSAGRSRSYGADAWSQPRDPSGYGSDRYGSGSFGSGRYRSGNERSGSFEHIPSRQYDRDERGFFDRASDEVMSWFGDDDAARRRQMDQREDHRGKGPSGYTRSNERLLEEANERLMHDSSLDASKVSVSCDDSEITLSGTVDSRSAKRRAEDIVDDIAGVKHVQNNLRVESRDSYYSQSRTTGES